jgi:GNAT superfamily N-acetyltransferase
MTALLPVTRVAEAGEWSLMIETLASSFDADPAVRWMYPDAQQYQRHFPAFVQAFGGRAVEHGTAYCADWHSGVALWLPPGIGPDEEALTALLEATVGERERSAIFAMFELMGSYHPSEEHWYLPLLGVEASRQGEGYGSALMRAALTRCDEEKRPAYLEATSRQSLPFYERHGFAQLGTIQVGKSPPVFPMLRRPR